MGNEAKNSENLNQDSKRIYKKQIFFYIHDIALWYLTIYKGTFTYILLRENVFLKRTKCNQYYNVWYRKATLWMACIRWV